MRKLFFAALAVVFMAGTASAAVQNVKVSGSVDSTYVNRKNFDLGEDGGSDHRKQSSFITQTSLRVDADLTDNVSATIALLNERAWESSPGSTATDIELQLAFAVLREFLYSPLTLTVGRQEFIFGNGFIMDSAAGSGDSAISSVASDLSKRFALDAVRATLDYNPLTLDLVYFRDTDGASAGFFTGSSTSIDVYGINANYALGDTMNSIIEAYYWKKWDRTDSNSATDQEDKLHVYGLRGSTNPIEGLSVSAEWAHQSGESDDGSDQANKNANAVQLIANYQVPVLTEYNPVLTYSFTKYSGDVTTASDDHRDSGWDSFYNDQLEGIVYTLFSKTNLLVHDVYLETTPMEDVTAGFRWQGLWLDKSWEDGSSASFTIGSNHGAGTDTFTSAAGEIDEKESYLGSEFDFDLTYDYTEDVQIGTTLGYFFPGDFFTEGNDLTAKQWLVNLNVAF